ncbi:hypothetical protein P5V53_05555 [Mycobacteroides abscessus subsp. abscessus]|nr:hypothetical protein [Mycobacteroides abscessus]MDO3352541.1 hypothetical protein [Mycobacteroides abscessus subsp. abscessus]
MVDQLCEWIALPARKHSAVRHVGVRRNDQRTAIRHLLQDVLERLPDGAVVAPWGDTARTDGRVHIGSSGSGLEDDEQMEAFSRICLEPRQGNDSASRRVLNESTGRVDRPVIGNRDEFDAKLVTFIEKRLVVVSLRGEPG